MKYLFLFINIIIFINGKIINNEEYEDIIINAQNSYDELHHFYVRKEKGLLVFNSDYEDINNYFNFFDMDEKTKFDLILSEKNSTNTYSLKCWLFKFDYNDEENDNNRIFIICELEGLKSIGIFTVNDKITFKYNMHQVIINFETESNITSILEGKFPFMYYKTQEINLNDEQDKINLEFKVYTYNNEPLFITSDMLDFLELEDCKLNSKKLICQIPKQKLDVVAKSRNQYKLYSLTDNILVYEFFVDIRINYPEVQKENIYINFVKLIEHEVDLLDIFIYETNITKLPKLKSDTFHFYNHDVRCYFIKHNETEPLFISCFSLENGTYYLEPEILNLTDIHNKYNFIFKPGIYNETVSVSNKDGSAIDFIYPKTFNFSKNNSIDIIIFGFNFNLKSLKFNIESSDLNCWQDSECLPKCRVPQSHFNKNRYYLAKQKTKEGTYRTAFETFGVNVILNNNEDSSVIIQNPLYLFSLLTLLIF